MESVERQVIKVSKLKLLLIQKDISQSKLSEISGVEKAQICNIVAGMEKDGKKKTIMLETAIKICKALNVTLNDLFWDED